MEFSALSALSVLDHHIDYLHKTLPKESLFVVGGAVRDVLLGITLEPHDIDMTLVGEPDALYKRISRIDRDEASVFRTEKFGTISIIRQNGESVNPS